MQSGPGMRKQSDSKRQYCVTRFALRTKLIDDQVLAALSDSKISEDQPEAVRQVVVLGAGMDTRAWRMDLPEGSVKRKEYACRRHFIEKPSIIPCHVFSNCPGLFSFLTWRFHCQLLCLLGSPLLRLLLTLLLTMLH